MFKVRSVVFLLIAALITGVIEYVGLHRAMQAWEARVAEAPCPSPAVVYLPDPAPAPPAPTNHQISLLSVGVGGVELDVDGQRLELPGYPAPRRSPAGRVRADPSSGQAVLPSAGRAPRPVSSEAAPMQGGRWPAHFCS